MSALSNQQALRRPTYSEIEALPDHVVGEIIAGELVVSPRPRPRHASITSNLGMLIGPPFSMRLGGPGGWVILDEPELSLGVDRDYDPLVPDLAGWRTETMQTLPTTAQFKVRPDWVCEVLSQSTARRDRMLKLPFYARAGVVHCWLVDPEQQTLEIFENLANSDAGVPAQWKLVGVFGGREAIHAPPFEVIALDLSLLWGPDALPSLPT